MYMCVFHCVSVYTLICESTLWFVGVFPNINRENSSLTRGSKRDFTSNMALASWYLGMPPKPPGDGKPETRTVSNNGIFTITGYNWCKILGILDGKSSFWRMSDIHGNAHKFWKINWWIQIWNENTSLMKTNSFQVLPGEIHLAFTLHQESYHCKGLCRMRRHVMLGHVSKEKTTLLRQCIRQCAILANWPTIDTDIILPLKCWHDVCSDFVVYVNIRI